MAIKSTYEIRQFALDKALSYAGVTAAYDLMSDVDVLVVAEMFEDFLLGLTSKEDEKKAK